ncbi:MAG: hypothetical protein SFX19_03330 [Alphaproteobacteria bacterium]|nr:hypothetical protein [Alphaproteobacteria bacterium]
MTKKIKLWMLSLLPMLAVFLLAFFYVTQKHVAGLSGVMPMLHLAPVFIWGVMHPRDISMLLLAATGIMVDVATALPLGFSALGFCLFFLLVRSQRKYIYREGFAAMWGYFALLLLIWQLSCWAAIVFFYADGAPVSTPLIQWLFTVLLYPLLHLIFYPLVERIGNARYHLLHA